MMDRDRGNFSRLLSPALAVTSIGIGRLSASLPIIGIGHLTVGIGR